METILEKTKKFISYEILMYLIFGVLTTVVDWVAYFVCDKLFHLSYMYSTVISWTAAVLFAFITNKIIVFRSRSLSFRLVLVELQQFILARLFTLLIQVVGMYICIDLLHIHTYVSKAVISVLVIVANYILSKLFIFKEKSEERS